VRGSASLRCWRTSPIGSPLPSLTRACAAGAVLELFKSTTQRLCEVFQNVKMNMIKLKQSPPAFGIASEIQRLFFTGISSQRRFIYTVNSE
jgi:hypothetical protein